MEKFCSIAYEALQIVYAFIPQELLIVILASIIIMTWYSFKK